MTAVGWTFTGTGFVLGVVAIIGLIVAVATLVRRQDQQDVELATLRHLLARRRVPEAGEPDTGQQVTTVDELLGDAADVTDTAPQPVPYPRQRVNVADQPWMRSQTAWVDDELTRFRFQPGDRDGTRHRHRPLPTVAADVGPHPADTDAGDGGGD